MYLFLKVEKGSRDELYRVEPETLENAIKSLQYGPLLCTKCWSGNKLDRSTLSIKSIPGGSCLLNRMGPADVSLERMRTISQGEGWGHCLYTTEFARTIERLNVAAMSVA